MSGNNKSVGTKARSQGRSTALKNKARSGNNRGELSSNSNNDRRNRATNTRLNCPTKPVVVVANDEDSSYDVDSQDENEDIYEQDDVNNDFDEQPSGVILDNANLDPSAEAKIDWDRLECHFDHEFDLSEYVTEGNKGLKLENNGMLTLSVDNGLLEMGYRSHAPDFISEPIDLKSKGSKPIQNSDIVKRVYIEGFKMTGWNERVLLNLATVPKFQEEGHFGDSKNVNQLIYPHEWKDTANQIEIINRPITNSMMNFQKKFPGVSPENLAHDIKKSDAQNFLVNLSSPLISVINQDCAADTDNGLYEKADLEKTNQVLVPKDIVKEYKAKTLEMMRKGVSYANITDNRFEISFEVPVPSFLKARHDQYVENKGVSGRQFLAFADTPYKNRIGLGSAINENIKTKSVLFKEPGSQFVRIQGKVVIFYKKMNQEVLVDL